MTDETAADTRSTLCWLDAFPWIEAAANDGTQFVDEGIAWWQKSIGASGTGERCQGLADLSDLALERLTRWTIGQIFPCLPPATALAQLSVTTRARNAFGRLGYRLTSDLMNEELGDLLGWPQVGVGTVDSILQALGDASANEASGVSLPAGREDAGPRRRIQDDYEQPAQWVNSVVEDLRLIASWFVALGEPAQPLLGHVLASGTPPEVIKARQRLELINAGQILGQAQAELDLARLLQQCISTLDDRTQEILARRFFADRPETLDELGRSLNITRERVRQLEAKARSDMVEFLEPGGNLELVGAAVRELVGAVLPLDDLIALLPSLAHMVEAADQPAWRVLDRLDDAYEIVDGWCASPTIRGAQFATLTTLQEVANAHGVVRLEDVDGLNPSQSGEAGQRSLRNWLAYCEYVLDGDYVFTRTQSVGDRASSILSVVGSPMAAQDILNRFGIERSLSSLKNAMSTDDRFERVDRDRWALTEWGLKSYSGLRTSVREELARCGGQVPIDDLIERITSKYRVTASSVVSYASSAPFELKSGIVRFASANHGARKSPERTRRLYRRGEDWLYRVRITTEHLRGSGSVAPIAIASILDLQRGDTRQLQSALGTQAVSWVGSQPIFGTIRRFLVEQDTAIGSEVFLVIGHDGSFRTEPVEVKHDKQLDQALALVGLVDRQSRCEPRVALAHAIGLPDDSPTASVIGAYRDRGDGDIADLLVSTKDELADPAVAGRRLPSAEISEIMGLL